MTLGLSINSTIQDNLLAGRHESEEFVEKGMLKRKYLDEISKRAIEQFDIRGANLEDNISQLSGGNLQKVILARELSVNPKVLIASQPTRGLDIGAINTVRSFLLKERERGCGILLISADLEELMSMSDRILILFEGNFSGEIFRDQIRRGLIGEEDIGLMMGGVKNR
jgi:simple sugar transport system ATP-binding protein